MLEKLRTRSPYLLSDDTFVLIRRRLSRDKRAAMDEAERDKTWSDTCRQARKLRRAAKRWHPTHAGFGALAPGIRLLHRRGRRAMKRAQTRERADNYHEWRKQVKALWYALRLIEGAGPLIRRDVRALHRAETRLGEDHDLVVLCAELSTDESICRGQLDVDRLRLAADRYRCRLRQQAVDVVRRLYARKSGAYVRAIQRVWKRWRQHAATERTCRRSAG